MHTEAFSEPASFLPLREAADAHAKGAACAEKEQQSGLPSAHGSRLPSLDNAVMENFFGLRKSELLYLQEFQSMEHFKLELVAYLDYYNNRRIKAKRKGLPPAIHRQQALLAA